MPVPVSLAEIGAPRDDQREQVAEVLATSLNFSRERPVARSHLYPIDDCSSSSGEASRRAPPRIPHIVRRSPDTCDSSAT